MILKITIAALLGIMVIVQPGTFQTATTTPLPSISAPYPTEYKRPHIQTSADSSGGMDRLSYQFTQEDKKCLALNVYWEARDQDLRGKIAIGLVTMTRVESKHYPNTVCKVVWQKNRDKKTKRTVAQFSWTLDGKSDKPKNKDAWVVAGAVAETFAAGSYIRDFTNGATLYHADYVTPYWSDDYSLQAKIGSHLFYK